MITLEKYYMGRDESHDDELTAELVLNANTTVSRTNTLMAFYCKDTGEVFPSVRSGWRPTLINARVAGASKKSKHITCQAIDLADSSGKLKVWVMKNLDKCEEIGLWAEAPEYTPSWLHLQTVAPGSGSRVFKP